MRVRVVLAGFVDGCRTGLAAALDTHQVGVELAATTPLVDTGDRLNELVEQFAPPG